MRLRRSMRRRDKRVSFIQVLQLFFLERELRVARDVELRQKVVGHVMTDLID